MEDSPETRRRLPSPRRLLAVGQTTGGVAHDFNNVLTAIVTRASLIAAKSDDPEIVAHARAILEAADTAREVTDRIRRILHQSPPSAKVRVSTTELLTRCVDLASARAEAGGVSLVIGSSAAPDVEGVVGDLVQVLLNLVANGIDATGRGGTVQLRALVSGGDVLLEVEDDGPGIPADLGERVFEAFVSTKGDGGTGLGLALCRAIVESHGGVIAFDVGALGRGALVRVSLPQAKAAAARGERRRSELNLHAMRVEARVLLVDDDASSLDALRVLLEAAGFEVVVARSVDTAMERLLARPPTLMVTDIGLGPESGWSLIQRVRALDSLMPIVVVSGDAATSTAAEHSRWGVEAVLRKPINPGSLVNLLRQLARARLAFAAKVHHDG